MGGAELTENLKKGFVEVPESISAGQLSRSAKLAGRLIKYFIFSRYASPIT